jgi:hypothetical protein
LTDRRSPELPRECLQHAPHDRVRTLAVFVDLLQVARERAGQIVDLGTAIRIQHREARRRGLLQLAQEIDREAGEVVDEVQRVLDLVCDPRRELT